MPDTHMIAARPARDQVAAYDAIVIGAGISGMFMLYRLRELGMTTRVFEAGTKARCRPRIGMTRRINGPVTLENGQQARAQFLLTAACAAYWAITATAYIFAGKQQKRPRMATRSFGSASRLAGLPTARGETNGYC